MSDIVTRDRTNLQQFVSTLETAIDADRTVTEDEADVVVGSNLHPLLYIHCPLQADPQAPTLTELWQLRHLKSIRTLSLPLWYQQREDARARENIQCNNELEKDHDNHAIILFHFSFVSYAMNSLVHRIHHLTNTCICFIKQPIYSMSSRNFLNEKSTFPKL